MINTQYFTYIPEKKTFVTEASDLGVGNAIAPITQTIFLVSERTGKAVEFELEAIHRDADNDITFWEYRDTEGRDLTVKIFND